MKEEYKNPRYEGWSERKNEVKKYRIVVTFNSPHWAQEEYITDDFAVKNGCYAIAIHGPKEIAFVIPLNEIHELKITPV